MKKFIFLFVPCFIVGYSISWQINKISETQNAEFNSSLVFMENRETEIEPPVIIEGDIIKPEKIEVKIVTKPKVIKDLEAISAESYLVANLDTGKVYIGFNSDKVFPIASLSKFITAVVATNTLDKSKQIIITQPMLDTYGDAGHLVLNEKYTPQELLHPLLLESSNDAAEALAQSFGYEKFITAMSVFITGLGMKHTSFKDASGLSPENVSNTKDLLLLAEYYYKNEKDLLEITKLKDFTLATTTDHEFHKFVSINPFVVYEPFIGGKTGRTQEAKESMISMFDLRIASTTYPVAVIILRSGLGEREIDTEKILDKAQKIIVGK